MEWNVIRTQGEADEFLELVEELHDWFIAEVSMVAGHSCSRGNASVAEESGYAVTIRFVYDSPVSGAGFSSFEMKFDEVFRLEVSPGEHHAPDGGVAREDDVWLGALQRRAAYGSGARAFWRYACKLAYPLRRRCALAACGVGETSSSIAHVSRQASPIRYPGTYEMRRNNRATLNRWDVRHGGSCQLDI